MKTAKIYLSIILFISFLGCSFVKKFSSPDSVETIYTKATVDYKQEDKVEDIIFAALYKAERNALEEVLRIFISPEITEQSQSELETNIFSVPENFVYNYKVKQEHYTDTTYTIEAKIYVDINDVIAELERLKLIGKKNPKKVVIYPNILSQVSFSNAGLLNMITKKLTENLYSASLLTPNEAGFMDIESILSKARNFYGDYLMLVDAKVYQIKQDGQFISGFYPYKTNLNLKIYSTKKGLITNVNKQAGGFGTSPAKSAKISVDKAVKLALDELTFPFEKAKGLQEPIILEVKSLKSFEKLKKFYQTLINTSLVSDFSLNKYSRGGDVTFSVYVDTSSGEELAALILRQKPFELAVEKISPYKIIFNTH